MIESNNYHDSGVFFVHDEAIAMTKMISLLRNGLGRPERLVPLYRPVRGMLKKIPRLREVVERFTGSLEISDDKFRQTFGWNPHTSLDEILTGIAKKYRRENTRQIDG